MTTITIPCETWDAMREALEVLNHLDAGINFLNTNELEEMVDKALSAAKAVSADQAITAMIETSQELGLYDEAKAVQPQACDMGAMCLDCQPRGKNGECPDQQPQASEPAGWIPNTEKPMTPDRARYFMERFKKEEKLLGPNEQAAVDYVLAMLAAAPEATK